MKKLFILVIAVIAFVSCRTVKNTSTYRAFSVNTPYAVPVVADLDISATKITYAYVPPKTVRNGGDNNVLNTAVREALLANGNADVLVGLETQIKYNSSKKILSVVITGYPAKYKNFRNLDEQVWYSTPYFQNQPTKRGVLGIK
ncbi:MAG: hypothetical protein IKA26_04655 [Alistipes sp.]|nr:hypothetical protein [Alistipes sp.]